MTRAMGARDRTRSGLFVVVGALCSLWLLLLDVHPAWAQTEEENQAAATEEKSQEELKKELDEAASQKIQELPGGEIKVLEAVVMSSKGRSQWKGPKPDDKWGTAKQDDVLPSGALIRTGRKSSMVLRVGFNATIVVDRNTRMVIPQIIQSGQTLKTAVQLSRGRADFKIDRVGLSNDFSVVTPSTTMAVRGTGYGVTYGGLRGTEVFMARRQSLAALELQYFLTRFSYYLKSASTSSDTRQNPAVDALFKTFGPPVISNRIIADAATLSLMADSFLKNPVLLDPMVRSTLTDLRLVDLNNQGIVDNMMRLPPPLPPPPAPPGPRRRESNVLIDE